MRDSALWQGSAFSHLIPLLATIHNTNALSFSPSPYHNRPSN